MAAKVSMVLEGFESFWGAFGALRVVTEPLNPKP